MRLSSSHSSTSRPSTSAFAFSLLANAASMSGLLFDDLDVGTEARPVKPQQPPGQLTQIVTGYPNGKLARPSQGIRRMNDQGRFRFSVAHFGDCKPGERSHSLIWEAVSACLARRR